MGVVNKYGRWTFENTEDCFGDLHTSFYHWTTKKEAQTAERNILLNSQAAKDFNEGLISHEEL